MEEKLLKQFVNDEIHLYISNSKYFEQSENFPYMLYWHIMNIQTGFEISKDLLKIKSYKFSSTLTNYREGETLTFENKEQTLEYIKKEIEKLDDSSQT